MLDHIMNGRTLGADVRALRKARGLTLIDLAQALDRSVGWLSQVERDLSTPSIADLGRMATLLDVDVSSLLQTDNVPGEEGLIVRSNARRPIGSRTPGLIEGLLSPDLTDDFEVIHCNFAPGAEVTTPLTRPTQEVGYIVKGRFQLTVADKTFRLSAGDSFRLRGEPFLWSVPYANPCEIIWVISPPVY